MKKQESLVLRGEFSAYEVSPEGRRTLVSGPNQIQYAGANLLAQGLAGTVTMPKIADIVLGTAGYDPGSAAMKSTNPPCTFSRWASSEGGFDASPSLSPVGQQSVICTGMFTGSSNTYYEFALVLDDAAETALAYWYQSGGIKWGVGTSLEIVWTIHLGAS